MQFSLNKHFFKTSLISIALLTSVGCTTVFEHQFINTTDDGIVFDIKNSYQFKDVDYRVIAKLTGDLTLGEDSITVTSMSPGSEILVINKNDDSILTIKEVAGKVAYSYSEDGTDVALNNSVVKTRMQGVFNNTPLAAKARVDSLLQHQGIAAVLNQVAQCENEYARSLYVRHTSELMPLDNSAQKRLIDAIGSIHGDYNHAKAVNYFLAGQKISDNTLWVSLLNNTRFVESDYEMANLLKALAPQLPNDVKVHQTFLQVTSDVSSDYEKYRLMSGVAQMNSSLSLADIANASLDIQSDYETYRLISEIAPLIQNQTDINAVLKLASSIQSDYEMHRALTSLPIERFTETQMEALIELAGREISSDYELARSLVHFAQHSPYKEALTSTFKAAIATMSSDSDKISVYNVL